MRNSRLGIAVALLAAAAAFGLGRVSAQEEEGAPAGGAMPIPEWARLTEHHEELAASCGTYDVACEMWMMPGAPAQEFTAVAVREMILQGRFLRETFPCDFQGTAMEGRLLQGYDPVRERHVHVWMDDGSPVMSVQYAQRTGDGTLVATGEEPDWMTGRLKKTRSTIRDLEDGTTEMVMYETLPDGSERRTMRMVYTRRDG